MSDTSPEPAWEEDAEPFDADELDVDRATEGANEADAAEQHQVAGESDQPHYRRALRDDVDPADAADQYREVGLDEEDYDYR